jgi:hypothetical protein
MADYALALQRPELNIVKREKWTEADLDELPVEEPAAGSVERVRRLSSSREETYRTERALPQPDISCASDSGFG